jgi:type II secretory pathway component PulC
VVKVIAPPPPPTQPVAPPPPPSKPFTAKLTGTILETDRSMALFTTQTGEIQFVSVGQMIDDAKVVQIEPEKVILDRNGQTLTLEMTEAPSSIRPTSNRPNIYNRRRPIP